MTMSGSMASGEMSATQTQMQATVAKALGITADELQSQLKAGRTVPQIAKERGVDLSRLRDAVMTQLETGGGGRAWLATDTAS